MNDGKNRTLTYARPPKAEQATLHPVLGMLGVLMAFPSGFLLLIALALGLNLIIISDGGPGLGLNGREDAVIASICLALGLLIGWAALFLVRGAFGGKFHRHRSSKGPMPTDRDER